MRRVALMGISGGGKTTLGKQLAARLGVTFIELDELQHGPNWTESTPEELRAKATAALDATPEGWVVDGNYYTPLGGTVLDRADTVVHLDPSLPLAFGRVVWRTTARAARRQELWNGNRESFRNMLFSRYSMPLWVLKQHGNFRRRIPEIAAQHPHLQVVRITTRREADMWVQSIQPTESMSGSSNGSERQKTPPLAET
jgi:adenylate kinase family enzyme